MGIFLRTTLAAIFIGSAVFNYAYPEVVKDYIDVRYKGLYSTYVEETPAGKYIPGSLITSSGGISRYITIGVQTLTGLFALFGCGCLFKFLALKFLLLAGILHLPCIQLETGIENRETETKKLMLIGALFCAVVLYSSDRPKKKK